MWKIISDDPRKPGELREWTEAILDGKWLAATLEAADLLYYWQQPSSLRGAYLEPSNDDEKAEIERDLDLIVEDLTGLPAEIAYRLCIIKYLTRMRLTSTLKESRERHAIEAEMAIRFLEEPDVRAAIAEFQWEKVRRKEDERLEREAGDRQFEPNPALDELVARHRRRLEKPEEDILSHIFGE